MGVFESAILMFLMGLASVLMLTVILMINANIVCCQKSSHSLFHVFHVLKCLFTLFFIYSLFFPVHEEPGDSGLFPLVTVDHV